MSDQRCAAGRSVGISDIPAYRFPTRLPWSGIGSTVERTTLQASATARTGAGADLARRHPTVRFSGRAHERSSRPGRHSKGCLHPDLDRQAQALERQRSPLRRMGGLPPQGLAGGPRPDLRLAEQRLVRPGHPAVERRRQALGGGGQPVHLRRLAGHASLVRRNVAPLGVHPCLASRAVVVRPRHRLRGRAGRRALPFVGRRRRLGGTSGAPLPPLGARRGSRARAACACTPSCSTASTPGGCSRPFRRPARSAPTTAASRGGRSTAA